MIPLLLAPIDPWLRVLLLFAALAVFAAWLVTSGGAQTNSRPPR